MTREEYMEFAECRQASFTYKKPKKFRDWLNLANLIDMKPNDEILEILGFVCWEMVNRLTKTALLVKKDLEVFEQKKKEVRLYLFIIYFFLQFSSSSLGLNPLHFPK